MSKRLQMIAWALTAAIPCLARAEALPPAAVVEDLTYLRDVWAAKDRSYTAPRREAMLAFVNAQIARPRPMERWELALVIAEAQALSGNNHTESDFFAEEGLFHTLPISFWLFPEGAIVTRAHPDFRRLLGARIEAIGGVSYAVAAQRVEKYIAGTAERKRYLVPAWLSRIEVLQEVGLAKSGSAEFDMVLPSGERTRTTLGAAPGVDPAAASPAWRASMVPGKGPNPWPHVLDSLGASLPAYLQAPDEFTSQMLEDGRVLYVRSTSLSPYEGEMTVQLKAYLIMDRVVKSGRLPEDVIVDLRYNGGGNFFNVISFATELTQLVGPRGHVYVITGRVTNSAAIAFTALLKAGTQGRTTLVGEEPSDEPWFWSEGDTLRAPASKLPLHYTDGYHDWAHGCHDLARCYWPVVFHGVAAGALTPDLPVEETFADYSSGKDPAVLAILADIARRAAG